MSTVPTRIGSASPADMTIAQLIDLREILDVRVDVELIAASVMVSVKEGDLQPVFAYENVLALFPASCISITSQSGCRTTEQ